MKGIDVSKHQGIIDWNKVKASGVEFAILRMGVGGDNPKQDDAQVLRNAKECERVGIPYGLYIYSYALTESNAHSEAQHMIRLAKQLNATLGYWYDMEDADGYKANHSFNPRTHKTQLTNFCLIFLKDMKLAGFDKVGIYANKDYFTTILDYKKLKENGLIWLAQWKVSKPSLECDIWQYSSKGSVDGIKGNVDMNISYMGTESKPITKEYYPIPQFTLIDSLTKVNANTTMQFRKKIAEANGITNYIGTAEQNIKMLELLNNGKLIKP